MALQLSSRRQRALLTYRWLNSYTRTRWVAGGLGALMVAGLKAGFGLAYPLWPVLAVVAVYVALQPLFTVLLERYDQTDPTMALAELAVDSLLVAALIYWTGGIQSPYHWIWIGIVMLAALAGGRKASMIMALAITFISGLELGLEILGVLPSHAVGSGVHRPLPEAARSAGALLHLIVDGLFFLMAGHLSGILVETAQTQARRLAVVEQELRRQEMTRRRLVRQVVTAQEEERKRVARELHDETSQMITALLLNVKHVEHQIRTGGDIEGPMRAVEEAADRALAALGRVIWALRPQQLDELGLVAAVRHAAETMLGDRVTLHFQARIDRELPEEVEITVYRVLQEAITNVARHAKASEVWIDLYQDDTGVSLRVEDNGIGFRPDEVHQDAEGGMGLTGMEERIRLFGGSFRLESVPGRGTRVSARIPLESEEVAAGDSHSGADCGRSADDP